VTAYEKLYTGHAWRKVVRPKILARDGYRCQIGGPRFTVKATEVDHIVQVADGGDWYDEDNLRAACRACNAGRGAGPSVAVGKPSRE
jgi:5-methylcytosine-specific restriction protein A